MGGINLLIDLFKKENGKDNYNDVFREYAERYWSASSIEAQLLKKEIQEILLRKSIEKESIRMVVSLAGIAVILKKIKCNLSFKEREKLKKNCIRKDEEWIFNSTKKKKYPKLEPMLKKHFPDL